MATKMIGTDEIEIVPGRRNCDPAHVQELALSIAEVGLMSPIVVRRNGRGGFWLVSGRHRLEAVKRNGEAMIECVVADLDDLRAELAEIDENLCRRDLTAVQRATATARRKAIFLALNPEAAERSERAKSGKGPGKAPANDATVASFTRDTAKATGQGVRTVKRDERIGEGLAPDVAESVAEKPIGRSTTQLEALASRPAEEQREIVAALDADPDADVREIIRAKDTTDDAGTEIPERLLPLWRSLQARAPEAERLLKAARKAVAALLTDANQAKPHDSRGLPKSPGRTLTNAGRALDEMVEAAGLCIPSVVCSACEGSGCARCSDAGWLSATAEKDATKREARGKAALASR